MTGDDLREPGEALVRDLVTRHGTIYGLEEAQVMLDCLAADAPTKGPRVLEFEQAFADFVGVKHAIAVSSGTSALTVALRAAGVGPGDEVIVPTITWVATANAAVLLGAEVVFADVQPDTLNIDPADVARKITERTKAIIPVHLYGQAVDMDGLNALAQEKGLIIIEDAAHAPGGAYRGRRTGSLGHLGAFSFHMQKNMSTLGEGGMVTTNDDAMAAKARDFRSHGQVEDFTDIGANYRMTDMQAAVGLVQLGRLPHLNDVRRRNAHLLRSRLEDTRGVVLLEDIADVLHVYHMFATVIRPEVVGTGRDQFVQRLAEYSVLAGTHYACVHLRPCYRKRGHGEGECPIAERFAPQIVTLPIHPRMTLEQVEHMARAVRFAAHAD